jgi:hypothetical protein
MIDLEHALSCEAIAYQGKASPLAGDLIAIFQDIIDYRDKLSGVTNQQLMAATTTYAERMLRSKLPPAVEKHTGVLFELAFEVGKVSNTLCVCYIAHPALSNEGNRVFPTEEIPPVDLQKRLAALRKSFDDYQGKFLSDAGKSIINRRATLKTCLETLFFPQFYHTKAKAITADEMAAYVLHEIGHIVSLAEMVDWLYNSWGGFTKPPLINIETHNDIKNAIVATSKNITTVRKTATKEIALRLDRYQAVLDSIDANIADTDVVRKFSLVRPMIASVLMIINVMLIPLVLTREMLRCMGGLVGVPDSKDGDFKHNYMDLFDIEHLSDKYCAMHGLGLSQLSILDKLRHNNLMIHGKEYRPEQARASMHRFNTMMQLNLVFAKYDASRLTSYGTFKQRNDSIGNAMLEVLRAKNITPEATRDAMVQYQKYKKLMETINARAKASYNRYEDFGRILKKISTLNGLLLFCSRSKENKLDDDYYTLLMTAKQLTNTELIYQHNRLMWLLED